MLEGENRRSANDATYRVLPCYINTCRVLVYIYAHICEHIYIYIYVCMCMHTVAYSYKYAYTYTYTYEQAWGMLGQCTKAMEHLLTWNMGA